jgi:protein-S-isoprenylcysteine O-methyltransferase Ste14
MEESVWSHFGNWWAVGLWIVLFGVFLAFIPFYKKSQRKPASVYLAFILALALEMFGVPLSMYILTAVLGRAIPEGVLWGHTLSTWIGTAGMYPAYLCYLAGVILVICGWRDIYRYYWSKDRTQARLVTRGIYRYIRHPQYTGFLLVTLGMLFEWATLPLLIMWPILVWLYVRLARREEADMRAEFGAEYDDYRARTGMFLPLLGRARRGHGRSPSVPTTAGGRG